jgi:hypothetical protein
MIKKGALVDKTKNQGRTAAVFWGRAGGTEN